MVAHLFSKLSSSRSLTAAPSRSRYLLSYYRRIYMCVYILVLLLPQHLSAISPSSAGQGTSRLLEGHLPLARYTTHPQPLFFHGYVRMCAISFRHCGDDTMSTMGIRTRYLENLCFAFLTSRLKNENTDWSKCYNIISSEMTSSGIFHFNKSIEK